MCCFKTRSQPARVLTVLSSLVALSGIAILALAVRFAVAESFFTVKTSKGDIVNEDIDYFKNISYGTLLGAGCAAFFTGFLGFFFTCCKKKYYAVFFGLLLSFSWVFIIILGAILTGVSYGSQNIIDAVCDG